MKKKEQTTWASITHDLKHAALLPQQRSTLLTRALQQTVTSISAFGAALIWPCREKKVPWKVYYAGGRRDAMHPWLSARLDPSLDVTMELLQHTPANTLADMPLPLLLPLRVQAASPAALLIIWINQSSHTPLIGPLLEHIEQVRQMLEAVLEVEGREEHYFSQSSPLYDQALIAELAHGSKHALSAFLSLTRVVANADFAFWAQAYQDVVEITGHLGARHNGFGFTLLHGQGVGGRVAAYGTMVIGDYRNSPYRDSSVSELVDNELIRSGIALPVRYSTMHDTHAHVAAVLYATRRAVSRFSLAECLMMQRLAGMLEPLPFISRPSAFFVPGIQHLMDHKTEWYAMMLHSNRIEDVETWLSQFIKGVAIVTDSEDTPYVSAHSEQLEHIQATAGKDQINGVHILSLAAPGVHAPGRVYLCPSMALPPPQWPDFFADLVVVCNLVISRMERTQDQLHHQREQWLHMLLQGKPPKYIENDGYRLGLPVEHGQVWILAWPCETMHARKAVRKRMTAENVALEMLKSPLLFLEDDMAVVLPNKQAPTSPAQLRNALLTYCGVQPLWIVQGGQYDSLPDLRLALTRAISLAQKARREKYSEHLLDISMFGLDSLLENPGLEKDLHAFADRLLAPLIEYDHANGTHLTETLVLTRTLGSAQAVAEQLAVHVNTIRYRLHRAEEILGRDQTSPKEQTATTLAAFIWSSLHHLEPDSPQKLAGEGTR